MKKFFIALFIMAFGFGAFATEPPDEGMWLPMFVERLNYVDMQEMGLQLTAEEIYSINNSSMKDAIVGLSGGGVGGFFCTGEIVSDKGLMFTNHHCGYDIIQNHSSTDHNYLKDGFWAYSMDEELMNENLAASFLIRMEDVTDSIIPFVSDTMSLSDRNAKVNEIKGRLQKAAEEDGKYNVTVKSFFGGNEYYLFVYETYTDVRLVGAPPSSIGKYGGDTDNWMWPRHTGDFCVFRVYSAPDGSPAKYAEDNVPLKPKHHLPISLKGVEKDDYAMIWGYPGGTERYLTSYGIEFKMNHYYPDLINALGTILEVWKEDMAQDEAVDIMYASNYAGLANAWKLFIGMKRGIKNLKVADKKAAIEAAFTEWVEAEDARKEEYGEALKMIEEGYATQSEYFTNLIYTNVIANMGPDILGYSNSFGQLKGLLEDAKENKEVIDETVTELREAIDGHFAEINIPTEKKVLIASLKLYADNVDKELHPEYFTKMMDKFDGDYEAFGNYIYEESAFGTPEAVNAFLDKPKFKTLEKDPAMLLYAGMMGNMATLGGGYSKGAADAAKGDMLFIRGLREMYPDKVFYPDANSSMRMTYGSVQDYFPADAVHYNFITTIDGVMEKEDPTNDEFIVPAKLKELYDNKDFGQYANEDGELITCFLSTNDITGGNSGSPVINGNGELIGIAFDGNWEAMSGDIAFEPEFQRTISVDARYVLFIIDKFAGAKNLIDELTIVK